MPSHPPMTDSDESISKKNASIKNGRGLTVASTVPDSHRIPFSMNNPKKTIHHQHQNKYSCFYYKTMFLHERILLLARLSFFEALKNQ